MIISFLTIIWLPIIIYWELSARKRKVDAERKASWLYFLKARNVVILTLILQLIPFNQLWIFQKYSTSGLVTLFGIILCSLGISLAIWARIYLGDNWSGTPSIKENHKLITTGPYGFIRHPIYTGLLMAFFGSAVLGMHLWVVIFAFYFFLYLYKLKIEEKLMLKEFPDTYPSYVKKTKMLLPFLI